jgi:hypothetical protein
MKAGNDIFINKSIKASGANAGLTLATGGDYRLITPATFSGAELDATGKPVAKQIPAGTEFTEIVLSGANAKLKINDNAYTLIRSMNDLAAIDGKTGHFALMNNLDASAWSRANMGAAAVIGTMSGTLAGMGHTVSNLTLNAPGKFAVGLVGRMAAVAGMENVLRDIGLLNVDVTGQRAVGALVGSANRPIVNQAYSTGKVQAQSAVGGLVGLILDSGRELQDRALIQSSYSNADVVVSRGTNGTFQGTAGGLLGGVEGATSITGSHATGNVTSIPTAYYIHRVTDERIPMYDEHGKPVNPPAALGGDWYVANIYARQVGGLAGVAGPIINSYATGSVNSFDGEYVGGLAGIGGQVFNSYATGAVIGGGMVGGLIGQGSGVIDNVYATGRVIGTRETVHSGYGTISGGMIGGLIGSAVSGSISNAFATGDVIAVRAGYVGGLVGAQERGGSISDSYATGTVVGAGSGLGSGGGLVGGGTYTVGTISDNSHYSDARVAAMDTTAPVRSETGRIVEDIQVREADNVRNAVNTAQNGDDGGTSGGGRTLSDQYIRYGDSDSYSARVKAISVEGIDDGDGECSEDDECD